MIILSFPPSRTMKAIIRGEPVFSAMRAGPELKEEGWEKKLTTRPSLPAS